MGRAPCCDKASVKKGPWSPEEDSKLKQHIEEFGSGGNWIALPHKAGLNRCGKSCRLRWLNYLRPNIKHGDFTDDEDRIICSLFTTIGSRWSIIAAQLPGRTDNDIKNYWNTKLKKKLIMGLVSIPEIKPNPAVVVSSFSKPSLDPSPSPQLATELWSFSGPPSCNGYVGLNNMQLQPYYYNYDHIIHQENILSFGGDHQASCSSSDGSCGGGNHLCYRAEMEYDYGGGGGSYENWGGQIMGHFEKGLLYREFGDQQKLVVSDQRGVMRKEGGCSEKQSGVWKEETPLDYSLEEIKSLISSNSSNISCSSNNNNNNNYYNNVAFDENYKSTGDGVMYYYY